LDADDELLERRDRVLWQPVLEAVEGLLAGGDLHPGDPPAAAVGLLDGGVEDRLAGPPDVGAGAVALDERDDGMLGNLELPVRVADRVACGDGDDGERGHATVKPESRDRFKSTWQGARLSSCGGGRRLAAVLDEGTERLAGVDPAVVAACEHLLQ